MNDIPFAKLHGLGNDFLILDAFAQAELLERTDLAAVARRMCDRRQGVGADGLIIVSASDGALDMRLFNADGGQAELSGNGARCALLYAHDRGLLREARDGEVILHTARGRVRAWIRGEADGFHADVDLGPPVFEPAEIPVRLPEDADPLSAPLTALLDAQACARIEALTGASAASCVSMGNPHVVVFARRAADDAVIEEIGPLLQASGAFPRGVNVHVVDPIDARSGRLLSWERGVGRTLACGTGAAAAGVCGMRIGVFTESRVRLIVALGALEARWDGGGGAGGGGGVRVGGPARWICEGIWKPATAKPQEVSWRP